MGWRGQSRSLQRVVPDGWCRARAGCDSGGPDLTEDDVWTDDAALRAFSYDNLSTYWLRIADALVTEPGEAVPGGTH
jgi:hypothetical protein